MDKPTREYSHAQETRVAKKLDLRTVPNSGATTFRKGDVIGTSILVECKTVIKPQDSITVQKEWFTKNREEAFAMGKPLSAVCFDFGDGEDYVAVSINDFKNFLDLYKESEEV